MLRNADLSKVEELYKATITHCKEVIGKGVVFVVGKTGSGKSTTINCLTDIPLKKIINPETDELQIVAEIKDSKHAPKIAVIGHEGSQTTFPALFAPKWIHNFYYCDLAGFGDTRGDAYDANAYLSAQIVAQMAAEIKGVICVIEYSNLTAARGLGFIELAKLMKEIFLPGSFKRYFRDCVKFVVTKIPDRINKDHVLAAIKKIGTTMKAEAKEIESLSYDIPEEIIKRPENLILIRADNLISSPQKLRDEINNFFKSPRANILHHHLSFLQKSSVESLGKILNGAAITFLQLLVRREEAIKKVTESEQAVKRLESIVKEEELAKNKLLAIIEQKNKIFATQYQLKEQDYMSGAEKINKLRDDMRSKIADDHKNFDQRIAQEIKEYQANANVGYQQQIQSIEHLIEQAKKDCSVYKAKNPGITNAHFAIKSYLNSIKSFKKQKKIIMTNHANTIAQEIDQIKQRVNDEMLAMQKYEIARMEEQISYISKQMAELDIAKAALKNEKENYLKISQEDTAVQINKIDELRTNLNKEITNLEQARVNLNIIEKDCHACKHDFEILANISERFSFSYGELKAFVLAYNNYQGAVEHKASQDKSLGSVNAHRMFSSAKKSVLATKAAGITFTC